MNAPSPHRESLRGLGAGGGLLRSLIGLVGQNDGQLGAHGRCAMPRRGAGGIASLPCRLLTPIIDVVSL